MIVVPAQLENITTRKDRTLKLTFGTQEMTPKKAGEVMAMANSLCYLAIKPEIFTKDEESNISKLKTEPVGKSQSKRLRDVLFRLHEQKPEGFTDFEAFYQNKMEGLITHFKNKLEQ